MVNMEKRDELKGKLGVFWHTQGSGKSYSMVMFVRKVRRKINGNFTFLIITDRDDLDNQIHKTFVRSETSVWIRLPRILPAISRDAAFWARVWW